jgi:hypothetical protein
LSDREGVAVRVLEVCDLGAALDEGGASNLIAPRSSLRSLPGAFLGSKPSPLWAMLAYRLTEEMPTPKAQAACALDIPRWMGFYDLAPQVY